MPIQPWEPVTALNWPFDTLLKGRNGITHRQKVMNKYLNIVDLPPVDGCDIISTLDVGMQDICEKALVDKLKEINANVGVAVLMEVATGEVKAIVNMMKAGDGNYYEMNSNAISDMLEPGSTFKTASIMVALEDGKDNPGYRGRHGQRYYEYVRQQDERPQLAPGRLWKDRCDTYSGSFFQCGRLLPHRQALQG